MLVESNLVVTASKSCPPGEAQDGASSYSKVVAELLERSGFEAGRCALAKPKKSCQSTGLKVLSLVPRYPPK